MKSSQFWLQTQLGSVLILQLDVQFLSPLVCFPYFLHSYTSGHPVMTRWLPPQQPSLPKFNRKMEPVVQLILGKASCSPNGLPYVTCSYINQSLWVKKCDSLKFSQTIFHSYSVHGVEMEFHPVCRRKRSTLVFVSRRVGQQFPEIKLSILEGGSLKHRIFIRRGKNMLLYKEVEHSTLQRNYLSPRSKQFKIVTRSP